VRAQARCATNTSVVSQWSSSLVLSIEAVPITITAAFLNYRIVPNQDFGYDFSIHEVNAFWSESSITWNDHPTWEATSLDMGSRIQHNDGSTWMQWHIPTSLVREWYSNPSSNRGLVIWDRMYGYDPNFDTMIRFYSSETTNGESYKPYVDLWWEQGSNTYHSELPVSQDAYILDDEPTSPHNGQTVYSGWLDATSSGYVAFVQFDITLELLKRYAR
jgi:hypothetical protein